MNHYLYLLIDIGTIFVPFLASFYSKHPFYKHWKAYFLANAIVAIFFIIWDAFFTQHGIWGFNDRYTLGVKWFGLPIEEILFFICIPYASVFIYFAMKYFLNRKPFEKSNVVISWVLVAILSFVFILNYQKWYTACTSLLVVLFLLYTIKNKIYTGTIYFSYLITLLPFFIVNGLLTGSCIDEPVVWYNNSHNVGIRLGTIPIEDIFYGFLMIAATIVLFEKFDNHDDELPLGDL